jgi:hypothetical protein
MFPGTVLPEVPMAVSVQDPADWFQIGQACAAADYPNSQDLGLAIGLYSLTDMTPLMMRISDHASHQARTT